MIASRDHSARDSSSRGALSPPRACRDSATARRRVRALPPQEHPEGDRNDGQRDRTVACTAPSGTSARLYAAADDAGARSPTATSSSSRTARPASTRPPRSARGWPAPRSPSRSDGELRDLRLPLHDGEAIRVLTDRDPEALAVLRHSTAHVMAEAVTHLWPGAKVAIGPGDRRRLLLRLRVPGAGLGRRPRAGSRTRCGGSCAAEHPFVRTDGVDKAELARALPRPSSSRTSWSWSEGLPGRRDQPLHAGRLRGSVPRAAPADDRSRSRPSSCSRRPAPTGAATRPKPMLTRIYGTAFFDQADAGRAPAPARGGAPPRPPPDRPRARPLPHQRGVAGRAVLAPPRDGGLERADRALARAEPRARLPEVRTPILYSVDLWKQSGHWDKYRDNMFFTAEGRAAAGPEADELPRPRPDLRGRPAQLPRPAAAAGRAGDRAPRRALGRAARPDAGHPHHPGRRAHLLHRTTRSRTR